MSLDFNYIGKCQEISLFHGLYTFEVWGAQGGTCDVEESGRGGYAKGTIKLTYTKNVCMCWWKRRTI